MGPCRPEQNSELTLKDFAHLFGTTIEDLSPECKDLIARTDFKYRILEGKERDKVISQVLKKIESETQLVGTEERKKVWEEGWTENLKEFVQSGYDTDKLIPKFVHPDQVIRYNRNYIMPFNPNFEWDFLSVLRLWLFKRFLSNYDCIYEFGCGTGHNLVVLAKLYPKKELFGLDYASSSMEIIKYLAQAYGWKIKGCFFDMFSPDENFEIKNSSAIFTVGTIEQLAGRFEPFLQFLLRRSPGICLHLEPIFELYDEDNPMDYLAIELHKKRGYSQNYFTRLKELEKENKIEILRIKRPFIGSLFMEGYSMIIWRPKLKE